MVTNSDIGEDSKFEKRLSKDIEKQLLRFSKHETNHEWDGLEEPSISNTENILFVFEGKFTLYHENKLSDSTIIWTSKRVILFGTEVRKSLVASMVSRELEQRRGLDKKFNGISPPTTKGWDSSHNSIKKVEIIKNGDIYSTFFFDEDKRLYIINDLNNGEIETLKTFLEQMENVEITLDEFRIPMTDILLLCFGGIGVMIIGWIIIVLFF
ncbi:MAG: hypothetical protein JSW11_08660 [Candidatus Heimdallarchaeota archaeon]|nr:MAG: hypothetical protein JSW11_08660 [Candidatus Heimdallarchaeota archaeon]